MIFRLFSPQVVPSPDRETKGVPAPDGRKSLEPADRLLCLVVNKNSGRCLSIAEPADPGSKIVQGPTPDRAGARERWTLLAAGNASSRMWMFYGAILLHGVCFAFFFVTGQLYTDQEAPPNLRGTAQGLLTFLTYGVGMFAGSILSGGAVDLFTTRVGSVVTRNWSGFWLSSAAGALVISLFVALFFRGRGKVQSRETQAVAAA